MAGLVLVIFTCGCQLDAPRMRMGCLPTSTPGSRFVNPYKLGGHAYHFDFFETNGIVYTCKGGHIDITHLRWNADNTRYLIKKTRKTLMKKGKGFSFNLAMEPSSHKIRFGYPENWDELPKDEKETIANEIALETGPYLAFNATLWHEILTWFGVHFIFFEPEFNSSFSWEDLYSNLLGTKLAVEVAKNNADNYNKAMKKAIDAELTGLGAQPRSVAIKASEKMRGKWFRGNLLVDTMRKNFNIGLDDGYITPVLVPGVCDGAEPQPYPVPTIEVLSKYGFSMKYEISPNVFEQEKIYKVVFPDEKAKKIQPDIHFPIIMDHIEKVAAEKYNYIF